MTSGGMFLHKTLKPVPPERRLPPCWYCAAGGCVVASVEVDIGTSCWSIFCGSVNVCNGLRHENGNVPQNMFASFKKKPSSSGALVAYDDMSYKDPVVYAKRNSTTNELFQATIANNNASNNRFAVLPQISLPASALESKKKPSSCEEVDATRRTYSPAKSKVYSIPIKPSEDSIPLAFEEDIAHTVDQHMSSAPSHRASMLGNLFPSKTQDSFSYSMVIKEGGGGPSEESFRAPVRRTATVEQQRATPPPPGLEESTASETSRAANLATLFAAAATTPPSPVTMRTISTAESGYRMLPMGCAEMERYAKMRKMGLPQGAIENAMLKDMVHPKSMFGENAINANPVPPQIVIAPVDEAKRASLCAGDKSRSLIEELARKQQEKKADLSGLSVEERIQLNKRKQVSGTTPISMISKLRPSSLRQSNNNNNGTAAMGDTPLILRPPSRTTNGAPQQQQQRKAKSNPFENLNDLLVCLKLDAPVLQVSKLLVAEGFDTPEKFVLFLGCEDEQEAMQHLSAVMPNHAGDVKKILGVLPLLEEMTRCKEALESHDSAVIDRALTEYQHLLQRLKEQHK